MGERDSNLNDDEEEEEEEFSHCKREGVELVSSQEEGKCFREGKKKGMKKKRERKRLMAHPFHHHSHFCLPFSLFSCHFFLQWFCKHENS